jgi:hypothetical protein
MPKVDAKILLARRFVVVAAAALPMVFTARGRAPGIHP